MPPCLPIPNPADLTRDSLVQHDTQLATLQFILRKSKVCAIRAWLGPVTAGRPRFRSDSIRRIAFGKLLSRYDPRIVRGYNWSRSFGIVGAAHPAATSRDRPGRAQDGSAASAEMACLGGLARHEDRRSPRYLSARVASRVTSRARRKSLLGDDLRRLLGAGSVAKKRR